MKTHYFSFVTIALLIFLSRHSMAQVSFTLIPALCSGNTTSVAANTGTLSAMAYSWAAVPPGPVFSSPASSLTTISFPSGGTFTIAVGILTSSGFDYATNTIVISQTPTLTVSVSDHTVCPPNAATLNASGASAYSWSPGSGLSATSGSLVMAMPIGLMVYTVTGTNAGCSSSSTVSIVTVVAPDQFMVMTTSSSVCPGATTTLTATGATSFSWTSSTFTGVITTATLVAGAGTYSLIESNGGNCYIAGTVPIGLADCTGINKINEYLPGITLYPNPAKDQLYVRSESDLTVTIEMMRITGETIKAGTGKLIAGADTRVDLDAVTAGIWFLKITSGSGSFKMLRFIKE